MTKLTVTQIKTAAPGRHADGNGLYLNVSKTGAKSWILRVQRNGKRQDFGLGSVIQVSLLEARQKALEGKTLLAAGTDPRTVWNPPPCANGTFEEVAREYHKQTKSSWKNGKHVAQWISTLEEHVFPRLGSKHVQDIDARDIYAILLPIWGKIPETARRVRQRVVAVLNYAVGLGLRADEAPVGALKQLMRGCRQPRPKHFASMPYRSLPRFYEALEAKPPTTGRLALCFLILTAARSGEVRLATWNEIDTDNAVWVIPGDRMKTGLEHRVPLSEAAISILEQLRTNAPDGSKLIFTGRGMRPLSDMTLTKALRSNWTEPATVHGFRSTFRNWAAEVVQVPDRLAESALAHMNPNKVEAAYLRTTFFEGRTRLMEKWANFVSGR